MFTIQTDTQLVKYNFKRPPQLLFYIFTFIISTGFFFRAVYSYKNIEQTQSGLFSSNDLTFLDRSDMDEKPLHLMNCLFNIIFAYGRV